MRILPTLVFAALATLGICEGTKAQTDIPQDAQCTHDSPDAEKIRVGINALDRLERGKGGTYDLNKVYGVLAPLNKLVSSTATIDAFRCEDSLGTVNKLVEFVNTDERTIRVNASLLLANVVDNSTICGVVDRLFDHQVNDTARFNMWQVVLVVAGYARLENLAWIKAALEDNRALLLTDKVKYERTLKKMQNVEAAVKANRRNAPMDPPYAAEKAACLALPNIAALAARSPAQ